MSIANYFTLLRLFIGPLFLILYTTPDAFDLNLKTLPYALLLLLVIAELSDAFDGFIARRFNEVTDLGKLLDPMADSIYRLSLFLTFTRPPVNLPMGLVFIFFYRDTIISTLRTICALKGETLAARFSGKVKACVQGLAAFIIIILMIFFAYDSISQDELTIYASWITLIAALYSVFSGLEYIASNREYIARTLLNKNT
jgi:CDP-diacylglycerol--glycerol-3-phosphate 3-phosphatidyltransferase